MKSPKMQSCNKKISSFIFWQCFNTKYDRGTQNTEHTWKPQCGPKEDNAIYIRSDCRSTAGLSCITTLGKVTVFFYLYRYVDAFLASACEMYSHLNTCVCTRTLARITRVSVSESHLCPLLFYWIQQCWGESAVTKCRWDLLRSPFSLFHPRPHPPPPIPLSHYAPPCLGGPFSLAVHTHQIWRACSLFARDRTSGDHFSVSSSSQESPRVLTECVGGIRVRDKEKERGI